MLHDVLAICSDSLMDFVLGLIGGGGSILAAPLLVYVVGIRSSHVAIGTSSVAVALSALSCLAGTKSGKRAFVAPPQDPRARASPGCSECTGVHCTTLSQSTALANKLARITWTVLAQARSTKHASSREQCKR
jgi:hypothetical protein